MQEQEVRADIQVKSIAEALDQSHCPGGTILERAPGLVDQVGGDRPAKDARHLTHGLGLDGKQGARGERESFLPAGEAGHRERPRRPTELRFRPFCGSHSRGWSPPMESALLAGEGSSRIFQFLTRARIETIFSGFVIEYQTDLSMRDVAFTMLKMPSFVCY